MNRKQRRFLLQEIWQGKEKRKMERWKEERRKGESNILRSSSDFIIGGRELISVYKR